MAKRATLKQKKHGGARAGAGRHRKADALSVYLRCAELLRNETDRCLTRKLDAQRETVAEVDTWYAQAGELRGASALVSRLSDIVTSQGLDAARAELEKVLERAGQRLPEKTLETKGDALEEFLHARELLKTHGRMISATVSISELRGAQTRICKQVAEEVLHESGRRIAWQTVSRYWREWTEILK